MVLCTRDYPIIKVIQATRYQGDIRYSVSRGIQCSYMYFISVSWTSFKYPGLRDIFNLDPILIKGIQLFKFIDKVRCLGMELDNKVGETTAGAYLLSITEIKNNVQQIESGALIITSNYFLGLI